MKNKPLHIAVTGSAGQLASCLKQLAEAYTHTCAFYDREALDITRETAVKESLKDLKPDVLINTAAYTRVDLAESEQDQAFKINRDGVANLVAYCQSKGIKLTHISTDYVFDGKSSKSYRETDLPNPQTVYGRSKLAGEQAVIEAQLPAYWIIRTSWLYSIYGANFYKTICKLAQEREELRVVHDQIGVPTQAMDLAQFILEHVHQLSAETSGIYHFANSGRASWFDFAHQIVDRNAFNARVIPVDSKDYPTAAKRPKFSLLDTTKIQKVFGVSLRNWRDAF